MIPHLPLFPSRLICVALLSLSLTACGGGAGAGAQGDSPVNYQPTTGTGGTGNDSPETLGDGFSYRTLPVESEPADFVIQSDSQSDDGYRYSTTETLGSVSRAIYIRNNDAPSSYETRLLTPTTTISDLVAQANVQGAQGYRFRGNQVFNSASTPEIFAMYLRDTSVGADYDYEALTPADSVSARQAQLNTQATRGYRYVSDFVIGNNVGFSLYVKDENATEIYAYQLLATAATRADFATLLNDQGSQGYRYRGDITLATDEATRSMFVRRTDLNATYRYELDTPGDSVSSFLTKVNSRGSGGMLRQGDFLVASESVSVYVDTRACDCKPLRLADPFID